MHSLPSPWLQRGALTALAAARSAAYAKSFALRMSEEKDYPRSDAAKEGTQP